MVGDDKIVSNSGNINKVSVTNAPVTNTPVTNARSTSENIIWEDKKSDRKRIWIGLIGFFVVLLIGFLFVLFSGDSVIEISEEEFDVGKSVDFKGNDRVEFNIDGEEHSVSVDSVGDSSVEIIVQSEIIKVTLNVGETKSFDLDGDGFDDLSVKLERIVDGEPVLFVGKFIEEVIEEVKIATGPKDESKPNLSLEVENESEIVVANETNENEILTCFESGGSICSDAEICSGSLLNVSDTDSCCDGACEIEEEAENISDEEFCSEKGMYLRLNEGYSCFGTSSISYNFDTGSSVFCCSIPLVENDPVADPVADPVVLSDELRTIWDSISDSGDCLLPSQIDYISNLENCSLYKCHFTHPFGGIVVRKGIIGDYDGKCHSFEETPNDGELYCRYSDSQLTSMVDYLVNVSDENVLQDMMDSGDCAWTFG